MKTIEQKAKAYDEAYKKVAVRFGSNVADEIFPELKESEDERIRKALIEHVKGIYKGCCTEEAGKERDMFLAWLEKQGKHANFRNKIKIGDKVTRNEDGVLVNLSQLNRVAKKDEKQGEPTEINPSEFDLRLNKLLKQFESMPKEELASSLSFYLNVVQNNGTYKDEKQGEQKPAVIIPKFRVGDEIKTSNEESLTITKNDEKGYWSEDLFICGFDEECIWDLVEPKPAWSEEDEKMCQETIDWFEKKCFPYALESENPAIESIKWLKSLKQRIGG